MTIQSPAARIAAELLGVEPLDPQNLATAPDVAKAIEDWRGLLGPENVLHGEDTRSDYAKTTLPVGTTPAAVLRPGTPSEVQELVRVARRHNLPLHAVSRGKNWGYGDACARTHGRVIVDLRRMDAIREVNLELGYAVIEAGVSQGQLYAHLRERQLPLILDVTGAGPNASVVGNILQRGFGHTPYGDRFRHTSGFEAVLADGRLINTGFGQLGDSQVARVFPWGAGPWIDGLFTQSDLAIITAACVWLMPRPEVIEGFTLKLRDERQLGRLIDRLRELRMGGVVRSTVHVANDLRVLSSRISRPTEGVRGDAPLPEAVRAQLRREGGVAAWNLLGALYGTEAEVRAQRRVVRRALGGVAPVRFFRRRTLERARGAVRLAQRFGCGGRLAALLDSVGSAFDLLEGVPTAEHLRGVRWRGGARAKELAEADLRDFGLIWVAPVIPMTGDHSRRLLRAIEPIFERRGFDLLATLSSVTDRAMCCVLSVNFDKRDASEMDRALQCATELKATTAELGYYSYRNTSVPLTAGGHPPA